jgi:hypothetical protein
VRAAPLRRLILACVVNQYAAHQVRGDPEEVGAVLPLDVVLVDQAQEDFVDEGGGLQRVVVPLAPDVIAGQPPQFFVNQRHQLVEGTPLPVAPPLQNFCDVRLNLHRSRPFLTN